MRSWNWERLGTLSGPAFVALLIVGIAVPGEPPDLDSAAATFDAYIVENAVELKVSAILGGLAAAALIWFAATLAARIRSAGEQRLAAVVVGGTAVTIAMHGVAIGITTALAIQTGSGTSVATKDLVLVAAALSTIAALPFAAVTGAVAIAGWRSAVFPAWYWALTGLATIAFAISGAALKTSGFFAPDGAYVMITNIVFFAWVVVTSGVLWTQAKGAEAPQPSAAAA